MEEKKIRLREEIPLEDTWATEDMFATDEAWEAELASLAEDRDYLAGFAGKLGESADRLYAYLTRMEQTDSKVSLLANYAMRKSDQDTRNGFYQAMSGKFMSVAVGLNAACAFETPEIMDITDEQLETFYAEKPELERYRRYLTNMRRRKAHTLSPAEEKLLAAAGEMSHAPSDIFGQFENADLTFPNAVDSEGKNHPLTQGTFISYQENPDRQLRKSAYENLYHTFGNYKNTAAGLLNAQGKQLKFHADARKYDSTLESALDRTNVPTSVYTNLIEAVHQNIDKMHRYIRLRKKLLGVEDLHFYDIYMPLLSDVDKEIPFAEAKQTVYDALYPLGDEYRAILKKGFESRWIDVYENVGKRGGAYSAGAAVHPYVLLNYSGTLDSHYVIFVAEVASTCNEALLMEYLLNKTTDKRERAFLINHFLEQFKGTLYRQTMFAEFELKMGEMVQQGIPLTAAKLSEEYKKLNELYFGEDMVCDDYIAMEWARIPHFYYNYYVFQYATGYSAAIALSQKILKEGAPAVEKYLNFLSGGRSKPPVELLKGAGVDMSSPEPVNEALELFGRLLDEMEQLVEEL